MTPGGERLLDAVAPPSGAGRSTLDHRAQEGRRARLRRLIDDLERPLLAEIERLRAIEAQWESHMETHE